MKVSLVTFSKKGARKDFSLDGPSMLIGRKTDADLRIPLDEVSREHCRLSVNGKKVVLQDLDSSNGTYVNDRRVVQAALRPGDRVKIGPVVFIVQIDGQPRTISPPAAAPAARPPAKRAPAEAPTEVTPVSAGAGVDEEIDLDSLEELNLDDVSDIDLDGLDADEEEEEDVEDVEEVENVEELDLDDLEVDEDSDSEVAK